MHEPRVAAQSMQPSRQVARDEADAVRLVCRPQLLADTHELRTPLAALTLSLYEGFGKQLVSQRTGVPVAELR